MGSENELATVEQYGAFKDWLSLTTGMPEDLLHVHMGLLIFVFFAVVLRRRMHSVWPVSAVATFAVLNEGVDSLNPGWVFGPSALDVLNTVLWPTVLFLVARRKHVPPLGSVPGPEMESQALDPRA
ncbi:MAG: hypothetical protein ACT4N8_01110 [Sphingosinicella sp.]|uniref:hypothetical protein n=1 Tax=Sphingosinicella sp. TaxID=1917971 RepID=UPI004037B85B